MSTSKANVWHRDLASTREESPSADIKNVEHLKSPRNIVDSYPLSTDLTQFILDTRQSISNILKGTDDRLLVVIGPCSIHDLDAALEYATRLSQVASEVSSELLLVMRYYLTKPRTCLGWKGFLNDSELDGKNDVMSAMIQSRRAMIELTKRSVPLAVEFLDLFSHEYLIDLVSWGAIGARTSESPPHREIASALPVAIGFKNTTDGNITVAIDAVEAARAPHTFLGVENGRTAITRSLGNQHAHIILRGSRTGPNYTLDFIQQALRDLTERDLPATLMIDASHGNCGKNHMQQVSVIDYLCEHVIKSDIQRPRCVSGVMVESFLVEGAQKVAMHGCSDVGENQLVYGQSITDPCIGWDTTLTLILNLAKSVRASRDVSQ